MANVNVTSDSWTEISITSGTIQNISATADIELSAEQTDNSGVVLKPSELYQWDNETIYARAVTEATGALRVVNFKKAAGGGGSYVLPVASSSTLGGVKIGSNLSIDADGVLSATGGGAVNYSTTEQRIGTWIDGKPLYQISFENPATSTDLTALSIDTLANIWGVADTDGYIFSTPYADYSGSTIYIATTNYYATTQTLIWGQKNFDVFQMKFITIQYTKTTY